MSTGIEDIAEKIIEGNKMIAKFLGCEVDKESYNYWWYDIQGGLHGYDFQLKFHSSWNWLMIVVEKIEALGYIIQIGGDCCGVHDSNAYIDDNCDHQGMDSLFFEGPSKIEVTHKAVVFFIDLFNQNILTP